MKPALAALLFMWLVTSTTAALADDAACIDANEKSISLRRAGHLRDALKQSAVCAASACPREIADECSRRARVLTDATPTLILSATDGAGADLTAAKVTIDGTITAEKLDGQPFPIDPGPHTIRLENGGIVVDKTIVVRESEKARRENFVLAKPEAPKPPPPPAPPEDRGLGPQRTAAIAVGGVGAAGVVLGVVTGILATSKQSNEKDACSTASCPDPKGARSDYDSAHTFATISTIGIIAGAALVAGGAVLWITAPKSSRATTGTLITPLRWTF